MDISRECTGATGMKLHEQLIYDVLHVHFRDQSENRSNQVESSSEHYDVPK